MGFLYERELEVAARAVMEAARLTRAVQDDISPVALEKKDKSPVTVADFGSQALICNTLSIHFPGDPIIAEERSNALQQPENQPLLDKVVHYVRSVRTSEVGEEEVCSWIDRGNAGSYSERFWTLDPVDGTKGFLRREQYAIALALIVDGTVEAAVLGCPNLGDDPEATDRTGTLFIAGRGYGVKARPLFREAATAPVRTSRLDEIAAARFCESVEAGHSSHNDAAAIAEVLGIRTESVRLDSQAKYGIVARGSADLYLRLPTRADYVERIWDHAAGSLVVTEAGGTVTDIEGRPLAFNQGTGLALNKGIVATNGQFHDEVIEAVRSVLVA